MYFPYVTAVFTVYIIFIKIKLDSQLTFYFFAFFIYIIFDNYSMPNWLNFDNLQYNESITSYFCFKNTLNTH